MTASNLTTINISRILSSRHLLHRAYSVAKLDKNIRTNALILQRTLVMFIYGTIIPLHYNAVLHSLWFCFSKKNIVTGKYLL